MGKTNKALVAARKRFYESIVSDETGGNDIYASYKKLADAICIQAIEDYLSPAADDFERSSIEKFFLSGWHDLLSNIDGGVIISKLRQLVEG